jgi:hypothetical protein
LRTGKDYVKESIEIVEFDKTISLLAIDFLLGNLGGFNEVKQKALQNDHDLSSGGFDKVTSSDVGETDRGVRAYFSKISQELILSNTLSSKRKDQLFKVRGIFISAGLKRKAALIDDFILNRTGK